VKLEVRERSERGSAEGRRLRHAGLVPGVLYGRGTEARAIVVSEGELKRALSGEHGSHAILDVVIDGDKKGHSSILKDYVRHPVRGDLLHFDLQIVRLDEVIQTPVAIALIGEAVGAKAGGVVTSGARELRVEALPTQVPDQIEVDISALEIGDSLHLSDVAALENVTFLDEPELLLVSVTPPMRQIEEEVAEEGEEGEEGAEGAEGEAAAEGSGESEASSE
jgi:large subunit ribosomal protein L25